MSDALHKHMLQEMGHVIREMQAAGMGRSEIFVELQELAYAWLFSSAGFITGLFA